MVFGLTANVHDRSIQGGLSMLNAAVLRAPDTMKKTTGERMHRPNISAVPDTGLTMVYTIIAAALKR
jgi:hypothetical protein